MRIVNAVCVITLSVTMFCIHPRPSEADELDTYRGIKTVRLALSDGVSDGCWAEPNSSKTFAEKELLSSGIRVSDTNYDATLTLEVLGYATKTPSGRQVNCFASYRVEVWTVMNGKLANLSLGFWVHMLTIHGSQLAFKERVKKWFPGHPKKKHVTFGELHRQLDGIRHHRNRVMHIKPIFDRSPHLRHEQILNTIGWFNDDMKWYTAHHSRVSSVINQKPVA